MVPRRLAGVVLAACTLLLAVLPADAARRPRPPKRSAIAVRLEPVATGLRAPLGVVDPGDGSGRLFVVLQGGRILVVENGSLRAEPFLDLSALVSCGTGFCGERGLLGLAFHPDFATNGALFVDYTDLAGDTVVARYRVSANDPNRADPGSAEVLLRVDQPFANHNGGHLAFGPDGDLYVGMGDGGSGGDPDNHGQRLDTLLGSLLRLDVGASGAYAIPPDNPFTETAGARPEIFVYGLRNPWRFSFDRATGDLWVADVGQNLYEEVNRLPAATAAGANLGWRRMEGNHCFAPATGCDDDTLVRPVLEYDHTQGCSVTGGFRYRGSAIPALRGRYVYGDYCSGTIWAARELAGGGFVAEELLASGLTISSFGEDAAGELYVVDYASSATGAVHRVVPAAPTCGADALCLLDGRYAVRASWENQYDGSSGEARPVDYSDFTGFLTFGDPRNLELVVKLLAFPTGVKVYYGQLTDLRFALSVTELATGRTRTYANTAGDCGGLDDFAFPALAALGVPKSAGAGTAGACVPDAHRLCLVDGRFAVEADWSNQFDGSSGPAAAAPQTDFIGLLTFTDPRNVELVVKTLDFGDRVLVLAGALSNLAYTLRVTDTASGEVRSYPNPAGTFCGVIDPDAF